MQLLTLIRHPFLSCDPIHRCTVRVDRGTNGELSLAYTMEGDISRLRLPAPCSARRADDLWRHTCLEAFFGSPEENPYYELNLAPSTEWAIYRFDAYRTGMADAAIATAPRIALRHDARRLVLEARLNLHELAPRLGSVEWRLGLSAVIETEDGNLSYWALAHPPGRPDFHHPDGFAVRLPPPDTHTPPSEGQPQ